MELEFLKEALFCGMTSNAFKFGTVLSLGWFWARTGGCSVLYRGSSMETIDFSNVLTVCGIDAGEIEPPGYVRHESNATYFYVVRRVNKCRQMEHTISAAVKVSMDSSGDVAPLQPNRIFEIKAEQISSSRVQLVWYYCPLDQKSQPACFKVYYDNQTGQINYGNPLATISYTCPKFYDCQSDILQDGMYLFAVRAQDSAGVSDGSLCSVMVQLNISVPDVVDIISAEAI